MDTTDTVVIDEGVEDENRQPDGYLPLARVKRIVKQNPEINAIALDAAKLVKNVAEEYVRAMAKHSSLLAQQDGRKVVKRKDLDRLISQDWAFMLLEETLDNWPSTSGAPPRKKERRTPNAEVGDADADDAAEERMDETDENAPENEMDDEDDVETDFNDTQIVYAEGEPSYSSVETPAPTMEYANFPDGISPVDRVLTFEEDEESLTPVPLEQDMTNDSIASLPPRPESPDYIQREDDE